jgi:tripartite-type tricarboxylate transporter receptor subunit TctC
MALPHPRTYIVAALACAAPAITTAQSYPARALRIVVASAPGATTDIVARALAQRLAEPLGQSVGVDNRPGAGGNIAAELVAKSAPDGYTLLLGFPGLVTNPFLYPKLGYDPQKDLAPVSLVSASPLALVVHPSLPTRNVAELVALAKRRPDELNFLSVGAGTSSHLAGELFKAMAGVRMVHVPYKSFGQGMVDLIGGRVSLMINAIPGVLPHVKAGKLRALGVTGTSRAATLPDVPTIAATGLPGYEVVTWNGILVAAATPADIVARLTSEIGRALRTSEARTYFADQGLDVAPGTAAEFATFMRREAEKWGDVIRRSGAKLD